MDLIKLSLFSLVFIEALFFINIYKGKTLSESNYLTCGFFLGMMFCLLLVLIIY